MGSSLRSRYIALRKDGIQSAVQIYCITEGWDPVCGPDIWQWQWQRQCHKTPRVWNVYTTYCFAPEVPQVTHSTGPLKLTGFENNGLPLGILRFRISCVSSSSLFFLFFFSFFFLLSFLFVLRLSFFSVFSLHPFLFVLLPLSFLLFLFSSSFSFRRSSFLFLVSSFFSLPSSSFFPSNPS